ncbi:MAG: NAD(P)H-binding protein [Trueperaceae bacterium]|nr:NAD(P)H-binding protein [Trueperaceae bacterium]
MILVTGASGNVGSAVLEQLLARDLPVRIGARRPETVAERYGAEVARFDFLDPKTYPAAEGCEAVFLLRPPAIANTAETLNVFVDVARGLGVSQIVFVSVAGAGDNPIVPHHAVEKKLGEGPACWTILRPGFFAQNIGDAYRDDIVRDDRILVPAGSSRVAFIDVRDVAEVAVAALTDPDTHHGQIYTLTGPEALTFSEVAQTLTETLGRPVAYRPATILGYAYHLYRRRSLPLAQSVVQTVLHVGLRFGQAETVDKTLATLLGRRPRTVRDYVRDHQDLWR